MRTLPEPTGREVFEGVKKLADAVIATADEDTQ